MKAFESIKELWESLMMYNERVIWNSSDERRELAVTRIEQLKSFTSGESDFNPYSEFMDDDF